MLNKMHKLNVIKYPSGRYGFVGHVPIQLGYCYASNPDQLITAADTEVICHLGPGFAEVKIRSFESEADAWAYEKKLAIE